jgi:WD repeat-containing protein 40A
MDKVFSAAWLSETQVVIGTKCQNLAILDVNNGKKTLVPSLNPLGIAVDNLNPTECHGIHSICINPSRTLLAVGAGKPGDNSKQFRIHVYCLPSFQHVAVLTGHDDMVFSVSWIDDYTLVSGSRDRSVKTWKLDSLDQSAFVNHDDDQQIPFPSVMQFSPIKSEVRHQQKVRNLVLNRRANQFFTLSADGTVKIWDSEKIDVTSTVSLRYTSETVCMAQDSHDRLVSVGSQSHISIIDPRLANIVHNLDSLDDGWGVRSMSIHNSLLSIGGGLGRISFYDLRAQRYIDWEAPDGPSEQFLQSGRGWICRDQTYRRHFHGMTVSNAVYSLAYDDCFGKLFVAGGPLQLNLKGSYAGLWK